MSSKLRADVETIGRFVPCAIQVILGVLFLAGDGRLEDDVVVLGVNDISNIVILGVLFLAGDGWLNVVYLSPMKNGRSLLTGQQEAV